MISLPLGEMNLGTLAVMLFNVITIPSPTHTITSRRVESGSWNEIEFLSSIDAYTF